IVGESRIGLHVHFLENTRPIGANSLIAQREQLSNLTDRFSRRYKTHDLELTIGKRLMERSVRASCHISNQFLSEHGTDILPAMDHFVERCDEFCARAVFGDITRRACSESPPRVLFLCM